jgi:hypothetical protein
MARRLWDSRLSQRAWSAGANAKGWHDRRRRIQRRLVTWQEASPPPRTTEIFCEGLAVPRETASPASEARRAKAQAARRERRPWMADANVRRRGAVNPEPGKGQAQLETGLRPDVNVRRRGMGDPEATFEPRRQLAPVPPKAPVRGWPYHGRRPRRPAKPGGRKRRRRGESDGHGWPTRTSGDVVRSIPSAARA